ncbi:MAG: competence/damage-inducible protein A [Candidatus Aminicenantes bacterium]|nr:MAG: competence/damage-inducible protein A [Candidatus Aminicenantes bacterium]
MKPARDRKVEILAVGSEMLTPHFQDTNSLYLTKRLNDLGLDVHFKTIVGDHWDDLSLAFKQALDRADLVIATGGLGPTKDDRTREVLASVLEQELVFRDDLLKTIEKRFARRRMKMPEVNKKQAYVIEGSVVLENKKGTAPGLWLEADSNIVLLLPGPPYEMEHMFENYVWPRMQAFKKKYVHRRVIKTAGLTESRIETLLMNLYPKIPDVQLTTLARPGQIAIHLKSTSDKSLLQATQKVEQASKLVCDILKEGVFSTEGEELEEVVGKYLQKRRQTLALAESCTGGFLGHRITNVPGSSSYFLQGVLAYSNQAKTDLLDVSSETIEKFGAVSPQVAKAMAAGIRKRAKATFGLSITGIAGPDGGTTEKPVGLVYTALGHNQDVLVKKNLFLGDRNAIKFQASQKALDMLRRHLLGKSKP